jgi:hypothetical protein
LRRAFLSGDRDQLLLQTVIVFIPSVAAIIYLPVIGFSSCAPIRRNNWLMLFPFPPRH